MEKFYDFINGEVQPNKKRIKPINSVQLIQLVNSFKRIEPFKRNLIINLKSIAI